MGRECKKCHNKRCHHKKCHQGHGHEHKCHKCVTLEVKKVCAHTVETNCISAKHGNEIDIKDNIRVPSITTDSICAPTVQTNCIESKEDTTIEIKNNINVPVVNAEDIVTNTLESRKITVDEMCARDNKILIQNNIEAQSLFSVDIDATQVFTFTGSDPVDIPVIGKYVAASVAIKTLPCSGYIQMVDPGAGTIVCTDCRSPCSRYISIHYSRRMWRCSLHYSACMSAECARKTFREPNMCHG